MLKEKLFMLVGFSLFFGTVGGVIVYASISSSTRTPTPVGIPNNVSATNNISSIPQDFSKVVLIAPKAPISEGAKLEASLFREVYWDRDKVPEGSVRDFSSIEGLYTRVPLPAGLPVVVSNLQNNPPAFGIENLLPEGYRAITIEVTSTTGVEGWATPGAKVDVLVTYRDNRVGEYKTKVAVENATVISYNGSARVRSGTMTELATQSSYNDKATVTLAVPFEASLKIPTAEAMGVLSLVLRNSSDIRSVGDMGISESDFNDGAKKKNQRKERIFRNTTSPTGVIRFTNPDGKEVQRILDGDNWYLDDD